MFIPAAPIIGAAATSQSSRQRQRQQHHSSSTTTNSKRILTTLLGIGMYSLYFDTGKLAEVRTGIITSISMSIPTTKRRQQNNNANNTDADKTPFYTATSNDENPLLPNERPPATPRNSSAFDWNVMAHRLCPNMVPQSSQFGPRLFALARRELGDNAGVQFCDYKIIHAKRTDTMSHVFYKWSWGEMAMDTTTNATTNATTNTNNNEQLSHTHTLFYLPIWKCANIQIREYFLERFNFQKIPPANQSTKQRKCMVTAIRDPISHFLAGYNEVEYRLKIYYKYRNKIVGQGGGWTFGNIPIESRPKERLKQFLVDFLSCPFERGFKGVAEKYPMTLELSHLYSMSGVLYNLDAKSKSKSEKNRQNDTTTTTTATTTASATHTAEQPQFNTMSDFHYLPSLTNISTQWGPFVAEKCGESVLSLSNNKNDNDLMKSTFLNTSIIVGSNAHTSSTRKEYDAIKQAVMIAQEQEENADDLSLSITKALCAPHLLDYACWKDLPDGVPTTCMDLYASYHENGLL